MINLLTLRKFQLSLKTLNSHFYSNDNIVLTNSLTTKGAVPLLRKYLKEIPEIKLHHFSPPICEGWEWRRPMIGPRVLDFV